MEVEKHKPDNVRMLVGVLPEYRLKVDIAGYKAGCIFRKSVEHPDFYFRISGEATDILPLLARYIENNEDEWEQLTSDPYLFEYVEIPSMGFVQYPGELYIVNEESGKSMRMKLSNKFERPKSVLVFNKNLTEKQLTDISKALHDILGKMYY